MPLLTFSDFVVMDCLGSTRVLILSPKQMILVHRVHHLMFYVVPTFDRGVFTAIGSLCLGSDMIAGR